MGKKKFIDRKHAATYALMLKESGWGAGGGEEDGDHERVFVRVDGNEEDFAGEMPQETPMGKHTLSDKTRQQLLELGFPDDGYNYMEHMRTIGTGDYVAAPHPNLVAADIKAYDASHVPVIGESIEFPVLRTKEIRFPRLNEKGLDPEVAAALEQDIKSEEEGSDLEDDFIAVANKDVPGECSGAFDDHDFDQFADAEEDEDSDREVMTTSKSRELGELDEQFELLAMKEYDDASDMDDEDPRARGHADISEFESVMSEFLTDDRVVKSQYVTEAETTDVKTLPESAPLPPPLPASTKQMIKKLVYEHSSSDEEVEVSDDDEREIWDCETIVSTFTNVDNHPAKIGAPGGVRFATVVQPDAVRGPQRIRIGGKQKLPLDYVPKRASKEEEAQAPAPKVVRPRGVETPEERKARKAAVKEEKRASRQAKKELKMRYKSEGNRAQQGAAVMGPKTIRLP